jgi:hypothetical protein
MITEIVHSFAGQIAHPVSLPGLAQSAVLTSLRIPADLLPGDGRFVKDLNDPTGVSADPGSVVLPGADVYAWAHNETSTGAIAPVQRVADADPEGCW